MLAQLPAFLAATIGEALTYTLLLLLLFVLLLEIRALIWRGIE